MLAIDNFFSYRLRLLVDFNPRMVIKACKSRLLVAVVADDYIVEKSLA